MKRAVTALLALIALALPPANGAAQPAAHTASYAPVPASLPVAVYGPDRTRIEIELAENIRRALGERGFTVVEEEPEDGLLLTFTTECSVPPLMRPRTGIDVGIVATEHGVTADIDVDARIVAPLQGDAAAPPAGPSLRLSMRLTGTGPRPRLYWTGEAYSPLGRKCAAELAPELATPLLDDLASRRAGPEAPTP